VVLGGCNSCNKEDPKPVLNADFTMMVEVDWLKGMEPFWREDSVFSESPIRFKANVVQKDWVYEWSINGSSPWGSPDSSLRFSYIQVPLNQKLPIRLRVWNKNKKGDTITKTRTIKFYNFIEHRTDNIAYGKYRFIDKSGLFKDTINGFLDTMSRNRIPFPYDEYYPINDIPVLSLKFPFCEKDFIFIVEAGKSYGNIWSNTLENSFHHRVCSQLSASWDQAPGYYIYYDDLGRLEIKLRLRWFFTLNRPDHIIELTGFKIK